MDYDPNSIKAELNKVKERFAEKLKNVRTGRAKPDTFNDLVVEAYGQSSTLQSVANVVIENALSVVVTPYDKSNKDLSNEIVEQVTKQLGLTPSNEGDKIRINIPPLTEETRKETVKEMYATLEEFRIRVRQVRQAHMDKAKSDELPEDVQDRMQKTIQVEVDKANEELQQMAEKKEQEIMKI